MPLTPSQLTSLAELIAEYPEAHEAVFGRDVQSMHPLSPWRHEPPPAHLDLIRFIQRAMEAANGTGR